MEQIGDRTEDWIVPPPPPGGDGARVSIERTLAELESRVDDAMSLARGSSGVWEAAEDGMQRIGEVAVLASEQAIQAAEAARDALSRATIAESHAERSAAAAAAAAMRADGVARRERPSHPRQRPQRRTRPPRAVSLPPRPPEPDGRTRESGDDPLRRFSARADDVLARVRRLERRLA